MTIIVNQPFGIGDVIYSQTLIRRIADGRHIVWPVMNHFIEPLQRAYPDIQWVGHGSLGFDDMRQQQQEVNIKPWGKCTVIPIRFGDTMMKVPYANCMRAKYDMYGMDFRTWKHNSMWQRDAAKETELFERLNCNGKYRLINRVFGSTSQYRAKIPYDGIEMTTIRGFSLFDWAMVAEQAHDIHTVSTSLFYVLEMLNLNCDEIRMYPRKPLEYDFRNIQYLIDNGVHKYHLEV